MELRQMTCDWICHYWSRILHDFTVFYTVLSFSGLLLWFFLGVGRSEYPQTVKSLGTCLEPQNH